MTDQASQLVALVKADGAAKLAKQQAENAAARAALLADARAREPLSQMANTLTAEQLTHYETDR
jgi:hypothetical protein